MLLIVRLLMHALELLLAIPMRIVGLMTAWSAIHVRLGPLRHVVTAAVAYLVFAVALVYVVAPIRGLVGHYYLGDKLRYDAERWLATAIYDKRGSFVGTFDPRLDSAATSTSPTKRSRSATTSPTPTTSPFPSATCPSTSGSASPIMRIAT